MFAKLPRYILNLNQIRLIEFEPDPPLVVITWACAEEDTMLKGADALALIDAVEQFQGLIDVSAPLPIEELKA